METLTDAPELFFDPFAPEGEELYDPLVVHASMWERYSNGEIEHDYTADNFVSDTQALLLDLKFMERLAEAQAVVANMHILCGHDQELSQRVHGDEVVSRFFESFLNGEDEDEDIDPKTGKRKKRKQKAGDSHHSH